MPYVEVPDPRLNSGKPGLSTDWKQIRDNQNFFNTQINSLLINAGISEQSIADDFQVVVGTTGLAAFWTSSVGTSDTVDIVAEHQLRLLTTGNLTVDFASIHADVTKQRIKKDEEYVAIMECRVKKPVALGPHYFFGWQDVGVLGSSNRISDITDCVGVVEGAATGWLGRTANGGSGSSSGDFGNAAIWQAIRLEFTCSATAGNRKVEVYLEDSLQATLATDANMPTGYLSPVIGVKGDTTGAATRELRVDYAIFTVGGRPLAA